MLKLEKRMDKIYFYSTKIGSQEVFNLDVYPPKTWIFSVLDKNLVKVGISCNREIN